MKNKSQEGISISMARNMPLNMLSKCAAACDHCFASCLGEDDVKMMKRCVALNKDCASICRLTAAFIASQSEFLHAVLRLCSEICTECATECGKHKHTHCIECEMACLKCKEACNEYYEAL